jgi:hypothetical protein
MKEAQPEKVEYVFYERAHIRAEKIKQEKMKGRGIKDFIGPDPYSEETITKMEEKVVKAQDDFSRQV